MSWVRVSVDGAPEAVEVATVVLCEEGASGVEVQDEQTFPDRERPLGSGEHRAIAYFGGEAPEVLGLRVREALARWGVEVSAVDAAPFTDESWKTAWKAYFKPTRVSARLMVAPPWEVPAAEAGVEQVIIEPGLAFGTGTHATTQLSMAMLDAVCGVVRPATLLDVGCGSGILSIACAKLYKDSIKIDAIDIDPEALSVSRENVARNGVEGQVSVRGEVLGSVSGEYDVVVANILAHVLVFLSGELVRVVAPGGRLVLCGIGERSRDEVVGTFGGMGLELLEERSQEGWTGLVWARP